MAKTFDGAKEKLVCTRRLRQEELCWDEHIIDEVRTFLESYQMAVKMLRLCREDARARAADAAESGVDEVFYGAVGGDEGYWLACLRQVRAFVESLPNRACKMMLYYHYIRALTVERAADELDISRRNAFRLKKRALAYAADRWRTAWASATVEERCQSCS